jgi:hypothetical protein
MQFGSFNGWVELGDTYYPLTGPTSTASVVWWSEFLNTDPEVAGSIPGETKFSEKYWVWNGVHSAS